MVIIELREALVEKLIQKYKGSVCFLDDDDYENKEKFPHYPIRVNEKGSCVIKKDASYKCNSCKKFMYNEPCFGQYHNT